MILLPRTGRKIAAMLRETRLRRAVCRVAWAYASTAERARIAAYVLLLRHRPPSVRSP